MTRLTSSRSRKPTLQFTLRALFVVVLVLGLLLTLFAPRLYRKHAERRVVSEITQLGGTICYDYQWNGWDEWMDDSAAPPGPAWIRSLFGDGLFASVHAVMLDSHFAPFADADLTRLKRLPELRELGVAGNVTDAGLVHLSAMTKLEGLVIASNEVTDIGMVHLAKLRNLKKLTLHTQMTDAGLAHLRPLTKLESLWLESNRLTGSGLEHVARLQHLQTLGLVSPFITDDGLAHLKTLTSLKSLWIDSDEVTLAGIHQLKEALGNCEISHVSPTPHKAAQFGSAESR